MLGLLSPAISAYALLLPVLGVIRGIIEILCCLMNPFCIIPAIIRLFVKWIPPFISLFPPFHEDLHIKKYKYEQIHKNINMNTSICEKIKHLDDIYNLYTWNALIKINPCI